VAGGEVIERASTILMVRDTTEEVSEENRKVVR
jgi:hypothetical protein